jgi:DNA-binding MarR family transcriptional regulator
VNYSGSELSRSRIDDEALIGAGLQLLPVIGASLYSAISALGQAYRLTPTQVKVLLQLGTHGQMTVGEIASALGVSMPAASELVDRLVEAGHLVRTPDPDDRRRVLVAATPASKRIGARLRDLRRAQLRHALNQLAPEERHTFVRSLEALVAGLTYCDGASFDGGSAEAAGNGGPPSRPAGKESSPHSDLQASSASSVARLTRSTRGTD